MQRRSIIPTVLEKEKTAFRSRLSRLRKVSRKLQIDFMDGKFVKARGISLDDVPSFKDTDLEVEAHLMVSDPAAMLEELAKKGFSKVIFHIEATKDASAARDIIRMITLFNMEPALAISHSTRLSRLRPLLDDVKIIVVMGAEPGKEHMKLMKSTYARIRKLKKMRPSIVVQVDIGVDEKTAGKLFGAGAEILNSGSFVNTAKDPREAIKKLLHHK